MRLSEVNLKECIDSKITVTAVLKAVKTGVAKNGQTFLTLTIRDKDTETEVKAFNASQALQEEMVIGKIFDMTVRVAEWNGGVSLILDEHPIENTEYSSEQFVEWVENYGDIVNRFQALLKEVIDTDYGKVAYKCISDNWEKFRVFPAGRNQHHTAFGGLLQHSLDVAETAKVLCEQLNTEYGSVICNTKMTVAMALMHDVMKVNEYTCDMGSGDIGFEVSSSLTYHTVEGAIAVEKACAQLGITDAFKINEMKHLILAHHGKKEYGSPVEPACIEAYILYISDTVDAIGWKYFKQYKDLKEHERATAWNSNAQLVAYYKATQDNSSEI